MNDDTMCPEGLSCGQSGVCWLTFDDACTEDAVDVWSRDTCGRIVTGKKSVVPTDTARPAPVLMVPLQSRLQVVHQRVVYLPEVKSPP